MPRPAPRIISFTTEVLAAAPDGVNMEAALITWVPDIATGAREPGPAATIQEEVLDPL